MSTAVFHRVSLWLILALGPLTLFACGEAGPEKTTITIYASIYESVITELDDVLKEEFPDIEVRWYQKGSEDVATKVNAEIAAGEIKADLIMTSDPFWYEELKEAGHLLAYASPAAEGIPASLKDPEGAFVTVRIPVMVMTANASSLTEEAQPAGFSDLTDPRWAGRVTMPNPLQSGSTFTAVAALSEKYGWDYFEDLKKNQTVSAGGNSSVLNRVASGEKDVGIILLENLLKVHEENPEHPARIVYPADGSILVPSPIAITADCRNPEAAKRIYDFMLSEVGQNALAQQGYMYSPIEGIAPPPGARPWAEIHESALMVWSPEYLHATRLARDEIKSNFSRILLE
jgi:iron(III) transport system substrate-binding protein